MKERRSTSREVDLLFTFSFVGPSGGGAAKCGISRQKRFDGLIHFVTYILISFFHLLPAAFLVFLAAAAGARVIAADFWFIDDCRHLRLVHEIQIVVGQLLKIVLFGRIFFIFKIRPVPHFTDRIIDFL